MDALHCHVGSARFEHGLHMYVAHVQRSMSVSERRTRFHETIFKIANVVRRYDSAFSHAKFGLFCWFALLCNSKVCF